MARPNSHNPNAAPLGAVIDVYLKHPHLGPPQPFTASEARRHAIEQTRSGDVPQVVAGPTDIYGNVVTYGESCFASNHEDGDGGG